MPLTFNKLKAIYTNSPQQNVNKVLRKLKNKPDKASVKTEFQNEAVSDILKSKFLPDLIAFRIKQSKERSYTFLGDKNEIDSWNLQIKCPDHSFYVFDWNWNTSISLFDLETDGIVLCRIPNVNEDWLLLYNTKLKYKNGFYTIVELLLPFSRITVLQNKIDYFVNTFDEILPYYLGNEFFGPLNDLNSQYNLKGKRVIEFGPFDGCQSAGLINLGVQELDCVEVRSENVIKTEAVAKAFNWNNLNIIMNDFHDVNPDKYGKYDLAFAHGVYYHSISPFLFLENLVSLSDNIFIGGFCATEDKPSGKFEVLVYENSEYRAKKYIEGKDFTCGINEFGYFFQKDDLIRFFTNKGYSIKIISEFPVDVTAGIFLRFLAQR